MALKILITSTSFIDTPGAHHDLLAKQQFDITTMRGPLFEHEIMQVLPQYDGIICGDDELTEKVLTAAKAGNLKYISKYGVGLDKIDLDAAKKLGLPVTNCPGVNQVSVAEHAFALLLTFAKNVHLEYNITKAGGWKRHISTEIFGKTIGIIGLGAIGKELAIRAKAFGLHVITFDKFINKEFCEQHHIEIATELTDLTKVSDIISLHIPLTKETEHLIDIPFLEQHCKKGVIIINTARGKLVDAQAIKFGLEHKIIKGYLADVLETEPMPVDYEMKDWDNVIITPHISSRTFESVVRQATFAVNNLVDMISKQ